MQNCTKPVKFPPHMLNFLKNFRADEDGAVTVDWVVLTAAIVGLGIAVMTTVGSSTVDVGDKIGTKLDGISVATY